jgi:hypothetical protein
MITVEKLTVYDNYKGDRDGLARTGSKHEKDLFADTNDWSLIDNFYQDIVLINDWLASKAYAENSIVNMKNHCDAESFEVLMGKLV